jgi:8-oxo-dGTP pyrophosphatase MutT (NUDIX family)
MPDLPSPTLTDVRRALALTGFDHEAAWRRMAPRPRVMRRPANMSGQARDAEVLLLLYPVEDVLHFVLTLRADTVANHKGQISLPGGAREPGDTRPGDTALRETCEELAICREQIELIGRLTPLYVIVSDFLIHPFVGCLPARPVFKHDPAEVAAVLEMPLRDLLDDGLKVEEHWTVSGFEMDVPFYNLDGFPLWGATAIILSEFEQRLRAILMHN